MKTIKLDGILKAKAPLHHGGNEKTGSTIGFRKIEMMTNDGIQEVPFIEGNAIRGKIRRLVAKDFLDRIGYQPQTVRLHHFFNSGGNLESVQSKDSGMINVVFKKLVQKYLPPIAVLGSSFLNETLSGKLIVKKAFPVCSELEGIYFEYDKAIHGPLHSYFELMSDTFQTRKDDLGGAKEEGNESGAQQMLVEYEVLIPGTHLTHGFVLNDPTPVQEAFFNHALQLWINNAYVGGKASIGFGELGCKYDGSDVLEPVATYIDFINSEKENIVSLLKAMDNVRLNGFDFVSELKGLEV